jgi:hypothetical protein
MILMIPFQMIIFVKFQTRSKTAIALFKIDFLFYTYINFPTCPLSHNFGDSNTHLMEANCKESSSANMASVENVDIIKLFAALSSQMTVQSNIIQEQIMRNDLKITTDFQKVVQANEGFKKDVCAELDDLRHFLTQNQNTSSPPSKITLAPVTNPTITPIISATPSVSSN